MAVAINGWNALMGTVAVAGVMAIETRVAAVTVKFAELVLPSNVAVMSAMPPTTPVARPELALTLATLGLPELQLEVALTSRVEPSL